MKKKLILLSVLFTLIVFSFVGCRDLRSGSSTGSGATSSEMNLNSATSGVISSVESGGKTLGGQVSGAISGVVSAMTPDTSSKP